MIGPGILRLQGAQNIEEGSRAFVAIGIGKIINSGNIYIRLSMGGSTIFNTPATPTSGFNKVAISYKSGDSSAWVNGTKVLSSNNNFTATLTLNTLNFSWGNSNNLPFFGKNKTLAVYKEALTDADLRCLTYPDPVATTFDLNFKTIAEQFTFTRGSEATFVNEQGLIVSTNQIGSELIVNGDFATDTAWSKSKCG